MDLLRELIYLDQRYNLKAKSKEIYDSESDEEDDEIEFIQSLRNNFIDSYLKKNNCQFILSRDTLKKDYALENKKY
tara:strand:- start:3922 stop:4149 length:228 start_codon:yes stop_codon:yes gene_type:complete